MKCYLCHSDKYNTRLGSVRDNKTIDILECDNCGLVYLSSLNHIEENHYEESGMHDDEVDANKWLKETKADDERRYKFLKEKITNKTVLDFGCGIGGFLDKVKKIAKEVRGVELEKALQPSFNNRNLNVFSDLASVQKDNQKYDVITAFHVVEHLQNPKDVLQQLSELLAKGGGEMIVEVPSSDDALLTLYENSAFRNFTYWSQHLFLFNAKTMAELVKQAGLKLNWIKHIQRYSLSNHLYWLAKGKSGGHQKWHFLNNDKLNAEYENQLASIGKTDTIILGISK
jgi:2-polyprenyl-3-methyl-5-hydroxy-6-metoxy-1,4-benzoquinol methylase